jgi:hypothetical protein
LLAVALFLLTRQWVFFLLIPAVGMAFGSRHRGHGDLRHGDQQRDER